MGVEESFALVQTVEFLTVVARNREAYTCTVEQIVVVVAVLARRDTSTQIVAVLAINQSRPRLHGKVLFTRVWPNIVSLYNPFTRNRANSVIVLLVQVR